MNKLIFFYLLALCIFSATLHANDQLIEGTHKRYVYTLTLNNFTPQEIDVFSGIALSSIDDVNARLIAEKTSFHFLNVFMPSKDVTFEVSSLLSPSQFREQMSNLFKRMNVEVSAKFVQQENVFQSTRTVSAYTTQLVIVWTGFTILLALLALVIFWWGVQFRLNAYASSNQSGKWIGLVRAIKIFPLPFLCRDKWLQQLAYWDKRVSQANSWLDNAQQLLHKQEIESSMVFVLKSLENNASNKVAQALKATISEQLAAHQAIQDEREQIKGLVAKSAEYAQAGKLFAALELAYTALELCQRHAADTPPAINSPVDSIKHFIKRISAHQAQGCAGIILVSGSQKTQVNCGELLRIGRAESYHNDGKHLDLTLPQDTLSRVHKSIAMARQENGFTIEDIGSANGMWLQYRACEKHKAYVLSEKDQIHLSPPDELGSVGFQIDYLHFNQSVALSVCQHSILPSANIASSTRFIDSSAYANCRWYLSKESFYLLFSNGNYLWYCASQWHAMQMQPQDHAQFDEVVKIDLEGEVWLHLSDRAFDVSLDGVRLLGSVPLPLKSQLSVNAFMIEISLIPKSPLSNAPAKISYD